MLELRARVLARIRDFMARRSILEVETPVLHPAGNPDPNIQGNYILPYPDKYS